MMTLSADEARRFLVSHHRLDHAWRWKGRTGVRKLLDALRCVQLDPLDPMGTNADLVVMARIENTKKGDIYRATMPGHGFEHFAKERCLLPARAFPQYRARAVETPWWRLSERSRRVPREVLESVLQEVTERGPVRASELADRGTVRAIDWNGWKGTNRMATMALEILWTRCHVVVAGRTATGEKLYDIPERALARVFDAEAVDFERWALIERVHAAGLLARATGPCWSMLRDVRTSGLPDALVAEGALVEVCVEGSQRPYLAPHDLERRLAAAKRPDAQMRILAPLDPLLWDRRLVKQAFGFDYVWEVYKPPARRRWGWYVCPLLHEGHLVGRIEARTRGDRLEIVQLWRESAGFDDDALSGTLTRHAAACDVGWNGQLPRTKRRPRA